jgi:beta propeller repeat protein
MKKRLLRNLRLALVFILFVEMFLLFSLPTIKEDKWWNGFFTSDGELLKNIQLSGADNIEETTCIPSEEICDNLDNDCDDLTDEEVCDFKEPEFEGYIVELDDSPVATYKVNQEKSGVTSASAISTYRSDLVNKQTQVESQIKNLVPGATIDGKVKNIFNGFIVKSISKTEAEQIKSIPGVKNIYPNYKIYPALMDSVRIINADDVWKLDEDGNQCSTSGKPCLRGQDIKIGIIDSGVDYMHPDLGGCFGPGCKVIDGWDFVNNDANPMDDMGHGTLVASIAAGDGDYDNDGIVETGEGLNGVAPDATIYSYKIMSSSGGVGGSFLQALERAVDPNQDGDFSDKLDIVSLSFGGAGSPNDPQSQAVDNAVSLGVVIVASAGNSGPGIQYTDAYCRHSEVDVTGKSYSICSPGDAKKAITVGASSTSLFIEEQGYVTIAGYSSYGPTTELYLAKPDVVAPGGNDVCGAQWDSYYDERSCLDDKHIKLYGTSFSAPHVSGAVALIKQAHPDWTPEQIKYALRDSAKKIATYYRGSILSQGWGGVDVLSAIKLANPLTPEIYPFTSDVSSKIDIRGNLGATSFQQYSLEYTKIRYDMEGVWPVTIEDSWINIMTSNVAPSGDFLLSNWDTKSVGENGLYVLRLTVIDTNGQKWSDATAVNIDNSPKIQLVHGFTYPPTIETDEVDQPLSDQVIYFKATATASGSETGVCNNCQYKWYKDGVLQSETSSEYSTSFPCSYVDTTHTIKIVVTDLDVGLSNEKSMQVSIGPIKRIGESFNNQKISPSIYGDKIVWSDNINGNYKFNVWMYDLSTHTSKQITTDNFNQLDTEIYGDKIVWIDNRNSNWDIYMYDLSTDTERQITTDLNNQNDPHIYEDKIVWQDYRNSNWDIYMYDLSTDTERQITTDIYFQGYPSIYGDKIVWIDNRNSNLDIYMYDLSTDTERQITTDLNNQNDPHIYEDKIVWTEGDIYMYDLSTDTERQITTDLNNQNDPHIYEDKIIYVEEIEDTRKVYFYDLSTDTERLIMNNELDDQYSPDIYGDKLIWINNEALITSNKIAVYNLQCLSYVCGDATGDKRINIGDVIYLVNYIFKGAQAPAVLSLSDINGDSIVTAGDVIYLINYLFKSGPAPICSGSGTSVTTQTTYTLAELQSYEQQLADAGITIDITPEDTTSPARSNGAPTGTLASGTTSTTISLTTNEASTCKYSTISGVAYSSMTNAFSTTGTTSHSQLITGLTGGKTYTYYVKCQDNYGNKNSDDYFISFSIPTAITKIAPKVESVE